MRPAETRLSCLGLLAILAFGVPNGAGFGLQSRAELLDEGHSRSELVQQMRACRNWFADAAARPSARDWASDAHYGRCREVIADALAQLDAHDRKAARVELAARRQLDAPERAAQRGQGLAARGQLDGRGQMAVRGVVRGPVLAAEEVAVPRP